MIESSTSFTGQTVFKPWFYTLVRDSLHVFFLLYLRFKTGGLENIPRDSRGVILAPNHASYLDPPAVAVAIKRHVAFMAKDYLFRKPVLGRALRWLGVLPIKTTKEDFRSVRELIRKLKQGYWIVVFPEGTRSSDGRFKEPEAGIGFLAMKSGAWVVPIYVGGAYEAFPRQSKWPHLCLTP